MPTVIKAISNEESSRSQWKNNRKILHSGTKKERNRDGTEHRWRTGRSFWMVVGEANGMDRQPI